MLSGCVHLGASASVIATTGLLKSKGAKPAKGTPSQTDRAHGARNALVASIRG
jgi:hypothetical protein